MRGIIARLSDHLSTLHSDDLAVFGIELFVANAEALFDLGPLFKFSASERRALLKHARAAKRKRAKELSVAQS